jgi:hypothetical protein
MFHRKLRPTVVLALAALLFFGATAFWLLTLPVAPTEPPVVVPVETPSAASDEGESKTVKIVTDAHSLSGDWSNSDTKYKGQIRLGFSERPGPIAGTKAIGIRWTPPILEGANIDRMNRLPTNSGQLGGMLGQLTQPPGAGIGGLNGSSGATSGGGAEMFLPGAPHVATLGYVIQETNGKKILVLKMANQVDFEVPFQLKGGTLTLKGGVFEVGGANGRPSFLQAELNGEWKRVGVVFEKK